MDRAQIVTKDVPPVIGPYSQAIRHGDLLFCSGVIAIDPETGQLTDESLAVETRRCLTSLSALCVAAGTDLQRTLRSTIYTTDLESFADINEVYGSFFQDPLPARVTIGVAALPLGARVEIDAVVAASPPTQP
jgi:2-iminobutanoate/2-iminopropanoate deaminase